MLICRAEPGNPQCRRIGKRAAEIRRCRAGTDCLCDGCDDRVRIIGQQLPRQAGMGSPAPALSATGFQQIRQSGRRPLTQPHQVDRVAPRVQLLAATRDDQLDDLPCDGETLGTEFLRALDRQGSVREAGRLVARYLMLGHPPDMLVTTLAHAVLREDADFHTYQMLEAGVRQHGEWGESDEGRHILIAVARYLAAHSPTERAQLQTAMVARRLSRGETLHEAGC